VRVNIRSLARLRAERQQIASPYQGDEQMNWKKSSYSTAQGNCVEVSPVREGIAVRDSKIRMGPVLRFSADVWQPFVSNVKAGQARG